jgi:hypothetical protein
LGMLGRPPVGALVQPGAATQGREEERLGDDGHGGDRWRRLGMTKPES